MQHGYHKLAYDKIEAKKNMKEDVLDGTLFFAQFALSTLDDTGGSYMDLWGVCVCGLRSSKIREVQSYPLSLEIWQPRGQ